MTLRIQRFLAFAIWLLILVAAAVTIARARFTADLSAFLPQTPTREQKVLLDQLRDGVVSRLILIGIEGGDMAARAGVSKAMAGRLRADAALASVSNGEPVSAERDQRFPPIARLGDRVPNLLEHGAHEED